MWQHFKARQFCRWPNPSAKLRELARMSADIEYLLWHKVIGAKPLKR
jgi:hypothetical protein